MPDVRGHSTLRLAPAGLTRAARLVAVVLALAGGGARANAQEMEVPVALQMPLFLKVISFDHLLPARAAGTLVVGIAYQSGHRPSGQVKDAVLLAGADLRRAINGLDVRFVAIDLDHVELAEALERLHVTVLYVAPMRGLDVATLSAATRAARVTTVTGVSRYVEQGLAIGVRLRGDRPQILVNLGASRLEGAELGAELLKLVQVL
jgi:hypothetical protein